MITFKNFLFESRSAPLYHGTPAKNLLSILEEGLKPTTSQSVWLLQHEPVKKLREPGGTEKYNARISGVSMSRSKRIAQDFVRKYGGDVELAIIEYDQKKLNQRYKIRPVNYWQTPFYNNAARISNLDEAEEFIITNRPIPRSMISKIWVTKGFDRSHIDRFGIPIGTL